VVDDRQARLRVGSGPIPRRHSTGSQLLFQRGAPDFVADDQVVAEDGLDEFADAAVDRLLHHNNIVATDGESYRHAPSPQPVSRPPHEALTHHAK